MTDRNGALGDRARELARARLATSRELRRAAIAAVDDEPSPSTLRPDEVRVIAEAVAEGASRGAARAIQESQHEIDPAAESVPAGRSRGRWAAIATAIATGLGALIKLLIDSHR